MDIQGKKMDKHCTLWLHYKTVLCNFLAHMDAFIECVFVCQGKYCAVAGSQLSIGWS